MTSQSGLSQISVGEESIRQVKADAKNADS
jgi:hypothetical protein